MTCHFSGWNFICHYYSHISKARRSWTDSELVDELVQEFIPLGDELKQEEGDFDRLREVVYKQHAGSTGDPELFPVALKR